MFLQPVSVTPVQDPAVHKWRVTAPLSYKTDAGKVITVPKGFISDGATIPGPYRPLFHPDDARWFRSAIVHDYLCDMLHAGTPDPAAKTRSRADDLLYEMMVAEGNSKALAWTFWIYVRGFSIFTG